MVVSCSNTKDPVYRIWDGSTWSATSSITTTLVNVCNHLEIASDPTSDEMILVVRDSGATVGNNYEALVWNGSSFVDFMRDAPSCWVVVPEMPGLGPGIVRESSEIRFARPGHCIRR